MYRVARIYPTSKSPEAFSSPHSLCCSWNTFTPTKYFESRFQQNLVYFHFRNAYWVFATYFSVSDTPRHTCFKNPEKRRRTSTMNKLCAGLIIAHCQFRESDGNLLVSFRSLWPHCNCSCSRLFFFTIFWTTKIFKFSAVKKRLENKNFSSKVKLGFIE